MIDRLNQIARAHFSIPFLFPEQLFIISSTIEAFKNNRIRQSKLFYLPTGGGKSICFSLPGIFLQETTLIIYPLRSLILDQEKRFHKAGLHTVLFMGGRNHSTIHDLDTAPLFILATPESLLNQKHLKKIRQLNPRLIVFDEAHAITDWGETFRPSYLETLRIVLQFPKALFCFYTATASLEMQEKLQSFLSKLDNTTTLSFSPNRENIFISCKLSLNKVLDLSSILQGKPPLFWPEAQRNQFIQWSKNKVIVYCRSRKQVERVAKELSYRIRDRAVYYYHAGMYQEYRNQTERAFSRTPCSVLVATIAFGMGVNSKNVNLVVHYDPPKKIENYWQEAGRAGRDQSDSGSLVLFHHNEWKESFFNRSSCFREIILEHFGHKPVQCSGCDFCADYDSQNSRAFRMFKRKMKPRTRFYSHKDLLLMLSRFGKKDAEPIQNLYQELSLEDADRLLKNFEKQKRFL